MPRRARATPDPGEPSAEPPPTLVISGPIGPADMPDLSARLRALLADGRPEPVECDVHAVVEADLGTIDALARLSLAARRSSCAVRLRHASPQLRELLDLAGLAEIVPCAGESVEPRR